MPGRGPFYDGPPLVVLHAGTLAAPLRAALDSFTAHTNIPVVTLSAGSVEAARRITELHDVPDLIALADQEIFPALLVPRYVDSWTTFARNRMVIALGSRPPVSAIDSTNWYRALSAPDVEVGRSDPNLDPAGYRALMVLRLAEYAYRNPWISRAVLARSPPRNVRPKSSDLIALLQTGALDYAFLYRSSAQAAGLRWLELPASINLGDDAFSAEYARAVVRIAGYTRGDSIEVRGAPIRYALAVPRGAPHIALAMRLQGFLLSSHGLEAMREAGLDIVPPRWSGPQPIVKLISPSHP
jgi:molybdate/tungstate transport system substrate-binding protein